MSSSSTPGPVIRKKLPSFRRIVPVAVARGTDGTGQMHECAATGTSTSLGDVAVAEHDPSASTLALRVTRRGEIPIVIKAHEAKVAARGRFESMVLTSPNMDYVLEYPVESTVIDTYADGRWGDHEYSRWPQVLQPDMWHVPCIPCVPVPPDVPEILWETLLPQSHWVEDRAIGFTGVGYIKTETRDALIAAANSAIQRCEEMGAPQRIAKYGRFLVMILRQVVDRMRYYPVVAEIAVAVAAHVQRVCLELAGLKTYIDVVAPRLASDRDHSTDVLPVLGAFVRDGTDAQN